MNIKCKLIISLIAGLIISGCKSEGAFSNLAEAISSGSGSSSADNQSSQLPVKYNRIVTWGEPWGGGDSTMVQAELFDIADVYNNGAAFAALKSDGTVIAWGQEYSGANTMPVESELYDVKEIFSHPNAANFVALRNDGTAVTWGSYVSIYSNIKKVFVCPMETYYVKNDNSVLIGRDPMMGGDNGFDAIKSSLASSEVLNIACAQNGGEAAAVLKDGSLYSWGDFGGPMTVQLNGIQSVVGGFQSFAALKNDGTVVAWGDPRYGGDSSAVQSQLTNVASLKVAHTAYAALKSDGTVITWGTSDKGGDSSGVATELVGVVSVYSTWDAFAALRIDGSVVTWGNSNDGGDSSSVQSDLSQDVESISAVASAFAALKSDGSVVVWGDSSSDPSHVAPLSDVAAVYGMVQNDVHNSWGFAIVKNDGTALSWGDNGYTSLDSTAVQHELVNVQAIFRTQYAYAAGLW